MGLAGARLRRRHRTTVTDPAAAKAPDLVGRDFTAMEPNTKYVGNITYLPLESGKFLYLATDIDLASPDRLGDRRSHAHRTRHRRPGRR
jgi:transposase InsO family protein